MDIRLLSTIKSDQPSTIFLTGVTGFVGKVALAELLRRRKEFNVQQICVLIRPSKGKSPQERFDNDVAKSKCFSLLPAGWHKRVEVISGDLVEPRCGINEDAYEALQNKITHIIHCAASIRFDLPVKEAYEANITSCLNTLDIARGCKNFKRFVNVSTAYVTPFPGPDKPIYEELVHLPYPAETICRWINEESVSEKEILAITGHQNTYTLTKCLAEHIVSNQRGDIPVTIVRPSIIAACWKYPFAGWIDSTAAYGAVVLAIGTGVLRALSAHPTCRVDIIPCDEVINRVIYAAFDDHEDNPQEPPRILYAAAGVERACLVDLSAYGIKKFYRQYGDTIRPQMKMYGSNDHGFKRADLFYRKIPFTLQETAMKLVGNKKMAKKIRRISQGAKSLNESFTHFTHSTFDFRPSIPFDDPDYKAIDYIETVCKGLYNHILKKDERELLLGGRKATKDFRTDLQWVLNPDDGNYAIRGLAYALRKGLNLFWDKVTFDRLSFEQALDKVPPGTRIALAPNHRSYVDFLLCSYLCFAYNNLGIKIPHIAAAKEFAKIPILGDLFRSANAFYLERNTGKENKAITDKVHEIMHNNDVLMFFVEGKRSRTGQFLPPRRGLLRAMQSSGETVALLPIGVSYDRVPEEPIFANELAGHPKPKMDFVKLIRWIVVQYQNGTDFGRIHLRCGEPIIMTPQSDVYEVAEKLVASQQEIITTTTYHLQSWINHSGIAGVDTPTLIQAIENRGGVVVDSTLMEFDSLSGTIYQRMNYHWMHWFYNDAMTLMPDNFAVQTHITNYAFVPVKPYGNAKSIDAIGRKIVSHLFLPICNDYASVITHFAQYNNHALTARDILEAHPTIPFDTVKEILRALADARYLSENDGIYSAISQPGNLIELANSVLSFWQNQSIVDTQSRKPNLMVSA